MYSSITKICFSRHRPTFFWSVEQYYLLLLYNMKVTLFILLVCCNLFDSTIYTLFSAMNNSIKIVYFKSREETQLCTLLSELVQRELQNCCCVIHVTAGCCTAWTRQESLHTAWTRTTSEEFYHKYMDMVSWKLEMLPILNVTFWLFYRRGIWRFGQVSFFNHQIIISFPKL